MRSFIAIELSEQIKNYLGRIQDRLKSSGADVKWVNPQNIHLTLKFLGDIEDKTVDKISGILEAASCDKPAFFIRLSSLGAFPNINFPRIIWVGIDKGDQQVKEIAEELQEKIAKIGIPKENKPFSAHLTIGRTKSGLNRGSLVKMLEILQNEIVQEGLESGVSKLTLFKSTLTPQGPIYAILKEANLKIN